MSQKKIYLNHLRQDLRHIDTYDYIERTLTDKHYTRKLISPRYVWIFIQLMCTHEHTFTYDSVEDATVKPRLDSLHKLHLISIDDESDFDDPHVHNVRCSLTSLGRQYATSILHHFDYFWYLTIEIIMNLILVKIPCITFTLGVNCLFDAFIYYVIKTWSTLFVPLYPLIIFPVMLAVFSVAVINTCIFSFHVFSLFHNQRFNISKLLVLLVQQNQISLITPRTIDLLNRSLFA